MNMFPVVVDDKRRAPVDGSGTAKYVVLLEISEHTMQTLSDDSIENVCKFVNSCVDSDVDVAVSPLSEWFAC